MASAADIGAAGVSGLAHLSAHAGDMPGAIQAASRALELDPSQKQLRRWLAGLYQSRDRPDLAREQLAIVERMESWSSQNPLDPPGR
ncbi:MAG: tetratricopeptide repeat protein [Pirellulales bacterium]